MPDDPTPNLGLTKPLEGEPADINVINDNMDIIDNNVGGKVYRHMQRDQGTTNINADESGALFTGLGLISQANFPGYGNGAFTIPKTGRYLLDVSWWCGTPGSSADFSWRFGTIVRKNSETAGAIAISGWGMARGRNIAHDTWIRNLNAGDVLRFFTWMDNAQGQNRERYVGNEFANYIRIDLIGTI